MRAIDVVVLQTCDMTIGHMIALAAEADERVDAS